MKETLLFRVDADPSTGLGHLMRCLALAQAWQDDGGRCVFLSARLDDTLKRRVESKEKMEVQIIAEPPGSLEDAGRACSIAAQEKAAWLVLDGYFFSAAYRRAIKDANRLLLALDDDARMDHTYADLVLNQNPHVRKSMYRAREPQTQLLLGSEYLLLRREFLSYRNIARQISEKATKVLITMGGTDPDNVTLKVIQALEDIPGQREVTALIGHLNPHYGELKEAVQRTRHTLTLRNDVQEMPACMAWADIAIASAGVTSRELAFMGVPSVLFTLSDNQRPIAQSLGDSGVALDLGWHHEFPSEAALNKIRSLLESQELRSRMSARARECVDGQGAKRVLDHMKIGIRR